MGALADGAPSKEGRMYNDNGRDPKKRLPQIGQWALIELHSVEDGDPPYMVARWIETPKDAADGWVCDGEPDQHVFFVRLGNLFNWWAAAEVRRWWPLPGGE